MTPININFDGATRADNVVHLPKIYQGAPYNKTIAIQSADATYTRDFSSYSIVMQARWTQTSDVLFELNTTAGTIVGTAQGVVINFPATLTDAITVSSADSRIINESRFVYDIELYQAGVVVERFAQGIGYIVANITR